MSQPRLDNIILQVARNVGENITDPTTENSFTLQDRLDAINEARKKVYLDNFNLIKNIGEFVIAYPEWKEYILNMTLATKLDRIRTVLSMEKNGVIINRLPDEQYLEAKNNPYSKWKGSATEMWFSEFDSYIEVVNQPGITTANAFIYTQPVNVARGSREADIIDPEIWIPDIILKATELLEINTQRK
jgi:hypothetical protein